MSNDHANDHADSDTPSDSEDSHSEPELMITTRERRKTAGNRYSQVVAQEQAEEDAEDDVALLFAEMEEGEDEEYNSDEADDEADMSSSDDDDQGPNAAADDMEGEQELAKQAKVERQKKRKADMAMTTLSGIRKKPRVDPTALHRAPEKAKPSKRKERQSWMPDESALSGRTSMRKQTVAHRAVLFDQLKKNEEQRLKNKALREEKEKQKQADAPRKLTQADRLAEAEKIERRNAKSLNRWETLEKQRAEEQAAKLAALKDRKLNGPVLTFHSAIHVYRGPKIESLENGSAADGHVYKKRGPKPKVFPIYQPSPLATPVAAASQVPISNVVSTPSVPYNIEVPAPLFPTNKPPDAKPDNGAWLAGIHEYASIPSVSGTVTSMDVDGISDTRNHTEQRSLVPVVGAIETNIPTIPGGQPQTATSTKTESTSLAAHLPVPPATQPIRYLPSILPIPMFRPPQSSSVIDLQTSPIDMPNPTLNIHAASGSATLPVLTQSVPPQPPSLTHVLDFTTSNATSPSPAPPSIPAQPVIEVTSTRNLVILQDFEDLTADARQAFSVFYGTKKPPKPTKHVAELCTITGLTAKYRDPTTGTSYANSAAYKKLRQLQNHDYVWSSLLGCYVGKTGVAARGVPEGFLAG